MITLTKEAKKNNGIKLLKLSTKMAEAIVNVQYSFVDYQKKKVHILSFSLKKLPTQPHKPLGWQSTSTIKN